VALDSDLAAFCEALPRLREVARQQGFSEVLDDVLKKVRAGTPVAGLLPRLGIPADTVSGQRSGTTSGYGALPGIVVPSLRGRTAPEEYACPEGHCDRKVEREPGGPLQRCWVFDRQLMRTKA
jgi:hypothetical protein